MIWPESGKDGNLIRITTHTYNRACRPRVFALPNNLLTSKVCNLTYRDYMYMHTNPENVELVPGNSHYFIYTTKIALSYIYYAYN